MGIHLGGFTAKASAAPGDLDPSFGTNGVAGARIDYSNQGLRDDRITDLAIQPDGKIIAAGSTAANAPELKQTAVVRLNPDGTLDSNFADEGKLILSLGSYHDEARIVALEANGNIVIAGYASNTGTWTQIYVARLNQDRSLDDAFVQIVKRPLSNKGQS